MSDLVFVFIGGGLGATSRYLISLLVQRMIPTSLPLATLGINSLGCFLIGLLAAALLPYHPTSTSHRLWLFLGIGLIGGFTTFSTFSFESFSLYHSGHLTTALLYILLSVSICLVCCFLGILCGRAFFS
ncbi:MAG: fluoride efflux transporter CrcB [Puniceicoccaceae bacterium]